MLRVESLESRCLLSRYTPIDLGAFQAHAINDYGLIGGSDAGQPAVWLGGEVIDLPMPAGYTGGVVQAVNDMGQAAGGGQAADGIHALVWDEYGNVSVLENGQAATAMNDAGLVAGYLNPTGPFAMWQDGHFQGLYGHQASVATAANDSGQLTGSDGGLEAFRWQDGVVTDLPETGFNAEGLGINGRGDVAGVQYHYDSHGQRHSEAVVWPDSGGLTTLGLPAGYTDARAAGITDSGKVVGTMNSGNTSRAFLWDSGHGLRDLNGMTDRGDLTITGASRIADSGLILATARPAGASKDEAVVLVPNREPVWFGWALGLQEKHQLGC